MDRFRFALLMLLPACLVGSLNTGCQRRDHQAFCDHRMDFQLFEIDEAVVRVSPLLPDENAELQAELTVQMNTTCHVETVEICGVRLVDRVTEEELVEIDMAMPADFDGVLPCYPSHPTFELVDNGTLNSAISPFCLREMDLFVELCSLDCDGHVWSGGGRIDIECF